ncbi:MAG: MBL fold metallo-hydrolase [Rhodothalassiaceae bacterium]
MGSTAFARSLCTACGFLAAGLAAPALAQVVLPDWETVEIRTHDLGHGIYMLEGFGGNIGASVGDDGIFLVDDQYAPLTEKVKAALARLSDKPVRFVINTHWHPDHTNGNEHMGEAGAIIVAHDKTRKHLMAAMTMDDLAPLLRPSPRALPILTFNDTVTFHWNGDTVRVVHIPPAHTDGDAIVQFAGADVIHVGDAYFNGFYPFLDVENGGDIDGMIAFLSDLAAMAGPGTRIIPGHGPVAGREDVIAYRRDLVTIRNRVAAAIDAGTSLEDLIAASPLADLNPRYAGEVVGEADVLTMVYRSLRRK